MSWQDSNLQSLVPRTNALSIGPQGLRDRPNTNMRSTSEMRLRKRMVAEVLLALCARGGCRTKYVRIATAALQTRPRQRVEECSDVPGDETQA